MRNSRSISVKEKILIVCQVIAGKKIQTVARKRKVSRPSVYTWNQRALDQLEKPLKPEKQGPKFKRPNLNARDKTIKEQKMRIEKLKDIIGEKEKQIKNLRKEIGLKRNSSPRPSKCPHCGFEKIYNNGTYKIKAERLFEQLQKKRQRNRDNDPAVYLSLLQKSC